MSIFPPICCNDKLGSFESAQHAWGIFGAQRALEGLGCALSGGVPRLHFWRTKTGPPLKKFSYGCASCPRR